MNAAMKSSNFVDNLRSLHFNPVLFLLFTRFLSATSNCRTVFEIHSENVTLLPRATSTPSTLAFEFPKCPPGYRLSDIISAELVNIHNGRTTNVTDILRGDLQICSSGSSSSGGGSDSNCTASIPVNNTNGISREQDTWSIDISFACQLQTFDEPSSILDYRFEESSFKSDNLLYVKVVLVSMEQDWNCSFVASSTAFISVSMKVNSKYFFWSDPCLVGDAIWCLGGRHPSSTDTQQALYQGTPRTFCVNESDVTTGKFAYLSSKSPVCSNAISLDIQLSPRATFFVQCSSSVTATTQNSLTNVCDNLPFNTELYDRALESLTSSTLATSTLQPSKMSSAQLVTNSTPSVLMSYPVVEASSNKVLALACGVGIGVGALVIVIVVYVIVIVIRRKKSDSEKSECFVESTMGSTSSTITSNSTFDKFSDQSTVVSEDIYYARLGSTSGVILKTGPTTGDVKKERNTYENVETPAINPPPEPVSREQLPTYEPLTKTRRPTTLTRKLYSMIASKAAKDPDYLHNDPGNSGRMSVNHDPGVNKSEGDIVDAWIYGSKQSDLSVDMAV